MAGARRGNPPLPEKAVVVAVRAEREISRTALAWALTHVVRPGDFVTPLAVICNHDKDQRRRLWSFPKFAGDCGNGRRGGGSPESRRKCEVSASCSQMALQFHGFPAHNESIPQEFIRYLIEQNSTWATILGPLGGSWHVKLHGDSKSLHFAEGWETFAAAHKLSVGDFLVFKYVGGMVFVVNIFDQTTCERDYSVVNGVASDSIPGQEENCERGDKCVRKQTTPSRGKRATVVMQSCEMKFEISRKRTAHSCSRKTGAVVEISEREFRRSRKQAAPPCPCGTSTTTKTKQPPSKHQPDGLEEPKPQVHDLKGKKTTTDGCKRGPSFEVKIKTYNKGWLEIPASFRKSNGLSSVHQLLLVDPKGRLWPAKLFHSHGASSQRSFLGAGWRDFRLGNGLGDGDVCVLELKQSNEMHVQIRGRGGLNSMEISEMDASPRFVATIEHTDLHGTAHLNIPKSFLSTADMSTVREVTLVDPHCRRWPVAFCCRKVHERAALGFGWPAFRDANDVQVGDVCVFSFKSIVQKKATFQVEVIKSAAGAAHEKLICPP